jgi:putative hydrolase
MLKIDIHLHTIASGHAHNTILEYVMQAKKLKMRVIGISDHGPSDDTTTAGEIYFKLLERIPQKIEGVRVLKGIEANIIDNKGNLDISDKIADQLDYVMANFHRGSIYKNRGVGKNTEVMLKTIRSGKLNVITHLFDNETFPVDVEKIAEEACKKDVLLELDLQYIKKHINQRKSQEHLYNIKKMVKVAKKYKKKLIVNSDAHNIWELGDDSPLKKIKKEIGLTDNMIINNYPKELFKLLKIDE